MLYKVQYLKGTYWLVGSQVAPQYSTIVGINSAVKSITLLPWVSMLIIRKRVDKEACNCPILHSVFASVSSIRTLSAEQCGLITSNSLTILLLCFPKFPMSSGT